MKSAYDSWKSEWTTEMYDRQAVWRAWLWSLFTNLSETSQGGYVFTF